MSDGPLQPANDSSAEVSCYIDGRRLIEVDVRYLVGGRGCAPNPVEGVDPLQ
jgi:hypothetical protein